MDKKKTIFSVLVIATICYVLYINSKYNSPHVESDNNFRQYYSNHYNDNNLNIWEADSLYFTNNLDTAISKFKKILHSNTCSKNEYIYARNQLLFIYDESRDQVNFDSIYIHYTTSASTKNSILSLQKYLIDNINNPKKDYNPLKFRKYILTNFTENHHLFTKIYIEYFRHFAYTFHNLNNSDQAIKILENLIITYNNKTKDLFEFYKLRFLYHFDKAEYEYAYYFSQFLKDQNNFRFKLSPLQIAISHLYHGRSLLFFSDNLEGFKYFDKAIDVLKKHKYRIDNPTYLWIVATAVIHSIRLHYDNGREYKYLLYDSCSNNILTNYQKFKVKYYELLETNNHKEIISASKELINESKNIRYLFHKDHLIPIFFMAVSERELKNYKRSNQIFSDALFEKHLLKTRPYQPEDIMNSEMLDKEKYSFSYVNGFMINHLQEYRLSGNTNELNKAYSYLSIIETLTNKDIKTIYENEIIELYKNKRNLYNTALEILYEKYLLGHDVKQDFINYSDRNKSEFLQMQKLSYFNTKLNNEIGVIDRKLISNFKTEDDYRDRIKLLVEKKELYKKYQIEPNSKSINLTDKVDEIIDSNTAIIAYNIVDSSLYVQSITSDNYKISKVEYKENVITKFKHYVTSNSNDFFIDKLSQKVIYQSLIKPWDIGKQKEILIIPDQALISFPFESVLISNHLKDEYLVDRHQLLYSHSIKTHNTNSTIDFRNYKISCFSYNSKEDFYDQNENKDLLPGAYAEVKNIKRKYPNSMDFYGTQCNRSNFIKAYKNSDVMHIAVHGKSDESNKYNNYLLLNSKSNKHDTLYGYQLTGNYNDAKLLILSSCETSKGQVQPGEGLYSLVRFFILNGSEHIISSKWVLDDRFGKLFFNEFYNKEYDKKSITYRFSKSLKIVRENKKFSHPYYWAGIQCFSG